MDPDAYFDFNLYLVIEDDEILLRDTEAWIFGRDLPHREVGLMYKDLWFAICDALNKLAYSSSNIIDVDALEKLSITKNTESCGSVKDTLTKMILKTGNER